MKQQVHTDETTGEAYQVIHLIYQKCDLITFIAYFLR